MFICCTLAGENMGKANINVNNDFFSENRKRFFEKMDDNTICVLFSGTPHNKSSDADYPFFANRNFYYLTGIEQEGTSLIICKLNSKIIKLVLCIRAYDANAERWTGQRLTREQASRISGIYDVSFCEGLDATLENMLAGWTGQFYIDNNSNAGLNAWLTGFLSKKFPNIKVNDAYPIFCDLRAYKSDFEVELIKKAISITGAGISEIYRTAKVGMAEYELAAEFEYYLAGQGTGQSAFDSIVATGNNYKYLHYPQLDSKIKDGDLILLDVGAAWGGLCSDISRAFPVSGKFSERQLAIYNAVRACQECAFATIKPGIYIKDVNLACKKVAGEKLIEYGIITNPEDVDKYYWHNVSHHIGLDVHDIISRDRILEAGNVITVEPGIYVPEWEVGLRIEDDVLVTEDGCENLSVDIPREADEIEKLIAELRGKNK